MSDMLTADEKTGLGVALNEATLLGADVDENRRIAAVTFSVLTLPPEGPPPEDTRLQLLLYDVSRVAASLRAGNWNDDNAPVQPFRLSELLGVVRSFGGCPIYGWAFFDLAEQDFAKWQDKVSLDVRLAHSNDGHSLSLFQEGGGERHLDLCFWFQELEFRSPEGAPVTVQDVIAGGRRWWDTFYQNDPRTRDSGMYPLK